MEVVYLYKKWYDTAQIPPSQSGVGAYRFMNYQQRLRLQGILDSVSKSKNPPGSLEQKISNFFAAGMDTNVITTPFVLLNYRQQSNRGKLNLDEESEIRRPAS